MIKNGDFQPGDLLACWNGGWLPRVISVGTFSVFAPRRLHYSPSHVAMICEHNGGRVWVESTTLSTRVCLFRRLPTEGMQAHWPEDRVKDFRRVDLYRLTDIDSLSFGESNTLTKILIDHFVKKAVRYDFAGAIISGTRVLKWTRLIGDADVQHSVFCSEVCAAVLMRLNRMNRDNPTRYNPGSLLRELVRTGTYRFEKRLVA